MMNSDAMSAQELNDAELVAGSLAGNRDAFGQIVARYQSLVCSLAYSATGSLTQSEDLAQETFLTAWKQLGTLREPGKLKAWLCRIARNRIYDGLREAGREPAYGAEPLDTVADEAALEPLPPERTISKEEEDILWRSIEGIPELYREPLILFYREHQSIESVAGALELSEDAVKQRLSRGRKLLQEQVLAFVEQTLERTSPGKAFTVGVLAALPALTTSAKAATLGVSAAKGSATAKAAGVAGLLGAILAPFLSFFGMWIGYRMGMDTAQSERERTFLRGFYRRLTACILGFFVLYLLLMVFSQQIARINASLLPGLLVGLSAAYALATIALAIWASRRRKALHAQLDRDASSAAASKPVWEYRSKAELFGWPLVHIRIGGGMAAQRKPVKAWIAAGDCAIGLLFAFGGMAIAPVSIGGFAVGLLPFGGCAVGVLSLGGFSVGIWSQGGLAVGWQAYGGCAVGWNAAAGGAAVAHDFALGGMGHAVQANNEIAKQFIEANWFFQIGQVILQNLLWLNLLWVVPLVAWWRVARRQMRAG